MSADLEYKYRRVRKAQEDSRSNAAWWYMSKNQIQIYIEPTNGQTVTCVISKRALRAMFEDKP